MIKDPIVVIVMPAYNAEKTVKDTFFEIPKHLRKYIISARNHLMAAMPPPASACLIVSRRLCPGKARQCST